MKFLLQLSRAIDALNEWLGTLIKWLVLAAVLISAGNAIVRKAFNVGSNSLLDLVVFGRAVGHEGQGVDAALVVDVRQVAQVDVHEARDLTVPAAEVELHAAALGEPAGDAGVAADVLGGAVGDADGELRRALGEPLLDVQPDVTARDLPRRVFHGRQ